ncbi:MAG TPA: glycosyltransferase [Nocardioides sp.]
MLALLSAALICAVVVLVPATLLVVVMAQRAGRRATDLPRAVAAGVLVGLVVLGVGALFGTGPGRSTAVAAVLGASIPAWYPAGRDWATRGLAAWALTVDAGVIYLTYVLAWTLGADLGLAGTAASLLLWLLEVFVFVIGVGYVWEFVDVLTRRAWPAYVDPKRLSARLTARPFVSLHVPTHNEPPDLVIATLDHLLRLEYDAYEILLIDNNTTDSALWRPVEAFCATQPRVKFIHLEDWPGYKSGALNHALTVTDPRAEVIGIVDADYLVKPDFLADCAPLFENPRVAFVQTPQDYRDWEGAAYFRRLYYSYGYFFDVSQKSRNERNGAIFGGTMGLIRRSALERVGGWDEWCITEDAELSLRLLKAGWRGVHIDESYGHGIMPLTFEALKRQRFRWCFGGIQLLRMHWRDLLPGPRTRRNRLTLAQRWAYLVGGLQWFGDLASVFFTGFLFLGAISAAYGDGLVIRRLSGLLLLSVVVVMLLGAMRALALVRRTSGATWGEALGAWGLWIALGWTVARASARGLFAREGVFLRTPKVRGELGAGDALRGNLSETLLALGCVLASAIAFAVGSVGAAAVGVLLVMQAAGYATAPVNSLAAIRSDLTEELRRHRRQRQGLGYWGKPARRGGVLVVAGGLAAITFLAFAAPLDGPDLGELREQATRPADRTPEHPQPSRNTRGPKSGSTSNTPGVTPVTHAPTRSPSSTPTRRPTQAPTSGPTKPTQAPTPTGQPTTVPTGQPTALPTHTSGGQPTSTPTGRP